MRLPIPGRKLPASPPAAPPPSHADGGDSHPGHQSQGLHDLNLIFGGTVSRFELLLGFEDAHKQAGRGKDGSGVGNEVYDAIRYVQTHVTAEGIETVLDSVDQCVVWTDVCYYTVSCIYSRLGGLAVKLAAEGEDDIRVLCHPTFDVTGGV